MHRFADRRFTLAAEDPLLHQVRHRLIQPFDVAHPAAQHDNARVEDIHHVGQRFRQPLFIAAQRPVQPFSSPSPTRRIISLPVNPFAAQPLIVGGETGAGDKGFDTPLFAAVARDFRTVA